MTFLKRSLALTALVPWVASAQGLSLIGGLIAQAGQGIQGSGLVGDTVRHRYNYLEHYLDLSAGYGPVSLWTSFEYSSPPQIGPVFGGLRKIRMTWELDEMTVSAGDLYGVIGRGLALNLWESQGIDWDSSLRGVWIKAGSGGPISLDLVSGAVRGGRHLLAGPGVNPRVRDFVEDGSVNGVAINGRIPSLESLQLGAYLVNVESRNPWFKRSQNFQTGEFVAVDSQTVQSSAKIPGVMVEYVGEWWDLYLEHNRRGLRLDDADSLYSSSDFKWIHYSGDSQGTATYATVGIFPGRFGINFEFKDYRYDSADPDIRANLPFRLSRRAPVQTPPTVFREHSSVLLGRTPHTIDFEDEMGLQVEATVEATPTLWFLLNASRSNRHWGFRKVIQPDFSTEWAREKTRRFSTDEKFFPFQEVYAELNWHAGALDGDLRLMASRAAEIYEFSDIFTRKAGFSGWRAAHSKINTQWKRREFTTVPTQFSWSLPKGWGATIYWEHQWKTVQSRQFIAFRDTATAEIDSITTDATTRATYYNRYFSLSVGRPSKFSIGFLYDSASDVEAREPSNVDSDDDNWIEMWLRKWTGVENKWFGLTGTFYLNPSTVATLFYGSLQGGLKCESGVCAYVPGIEDALTITVTSNF